MGNTIKYIKNPTEKVQLEAVRWSKLAIKYIIKNIGGNPSEKVQLEAVKRDVNAIKHFKNPSEKVKKYVEENS